MIINITEKEKKILLDNLPENPENKELVKLKKRISNLHKIKTRSAKNKGMEWQKEICHFISELISEPYDQRDDNCNIHSRECGLNGVDIILRNSAREKFNFAVECKNCNTISLASWIEQAKANATSGNWILFVKSKILNNEKIVVLSLDSFKKIWEK